MAEAAKLRISVEYDRVAGDREAKNQPNKRLGRPSSRQKLIKESVIGG
jgi:hypothetical protein